MNVCPGEVNELFQVPGETGRLTWSRAEPGEKVGIGKKSETESSESPSAR